MSNWVSITVDDLNLAKVAALVAALRTAALGSGQTDVAPASIQTVVDRVRRKIASCSTNRVDSDHTKIPAGLKDLTVALVLAEMKNRLEIELTQDERTQLSQFNADLNRIADGKDVVEQPDNAVAAPVQSTAGTPRIQLRRREFCRRDGDGI